MVKIYSIVLLILLNISTIVFFTYFDNNQKNDPLFSEWRQSIHWIARSNQIEDSFFEEDASNGMFTKRENIISPTLDGYTKVQSFEEEAKCFIRKATVKQITLYDMEQELCTSGNFHFVHILLETQTNAYIRLTGITPPRENSQCNFWVNGGYSFPWWYEYLDMLPEKVLTIGEMVRNIVVDNEYRHLSVPYILNSDTEKMERVDISHLPECEPNVQ